MFPTIFVYQFDRSYGGFEPIPGTCVPPATAEFPNGDTSLPYFRCHSGKLFYMFGTLGQNQQPFRDDGDLIMTQVSADIWTSFARSFNPTPDPTFLNARGFTNTTATLSRAGEWKQVASDNETPLRILNLPLSLSGFQEEQCALLGIPFDFSGPCQWKGKSAEDTVFTEVGTYGSASIPVYKSIKLRPSVNFSPLAITPMSSLLEQNDTDFLRPLGAPFGSKPMGFTSHERYLTRLSDGNVVPRPTFKPLPRLSALIIGINTYKNSRFQALRGAEPDAWAFKEYFERRLGVPSNHITLLLGQNATRSNIIQGFKDLAEDRRIQPGDPIVIFFAGHGGELFLQDGQEASSRGRKIEMLVPYDCSSEAGHEVPAIPDHTIGALIDQISKEKGDNITVILDCCHSVSETRNLTNTTSSRVRSVRLDRGMYNQQLDRDIRSPRTRAVLPTQYQYGGSKSHMLQAACASTEKARESEGRGNFSAALLRLLHAVPPDLLRYQDVLDRMDHIPDQNPQCEGDHRSYFLFGAEVDPQDHGSYSVHPGTIIQPSSVQYAESAYGMTPGTQFSISGDKIKLMASVANAFNSALHPASRSNPNFMSNQPNMAVQNHFGPGEHFRLYVPPHDPFHQLFKTVRDCTTASADLGLNHIVLVENARIAHLGAHTHSSGKSVIFNVLDERATRYGFRRQFDSVSTEIDAVAHVLSRAGHFFRTLNRSSKSTGAANQVDIELHRLEETSRDHKTGDVTLMPIGRNLCENGCIDLPMADKNTPYGFKIINNSSHRFYAYLFYFDCSDLGITPLYRAPEAPQTYQTEFSLKKGGSLTIGYGSGGVTPFSFILRENQHMDVGFLKLFISTIPIDLDFIPQGSPFSNSTRVMQIREGKKGELWDDILIPFILRRDNFQFSSVVGKRPFTQITPLSSTSARASNDSNKPVASYSSTSARPSDTGNRSYTPITPDSLTSGVSNKSSTLTTPNVPRSLTSGVHNSGVHNRLLTLTTSHSSISARTSDIDNRSITTPALPSIAVYCIAASRALYHERKITSNIAEAFSRWEIHESEYNIQAGFDETLIQDEIGYLEQIHIFVSSNVIDDPPQMLMTDLGKILSPFSGMLFTASASYYIPIFNESGTIMDLDELVQKTVDRFIDAGASAVMPPATIGLAFSNGSSGFSSGDFGQRDTKENSGKASKKGKGRDDNRDGSFKNGGKDSGDPSEDPEGPRA